MLLELSESDVVGIFTETLSAQTEPVLADDSMLVGTHTTLAGTRSVRSRVGKPDFAMNHLVW